MMRKHLFCSLLFLLFACSTSIAQDVTTSDPDDGWTTGDILAGANATLNNVPWNQFQLSPEIGYAISDIDLVTLGITYVTDDGVSTHNYTAGYQRSVLFDGFYVGVGLEYSKVTGQEDSITLNGDIGFFHKLAPSWYVSPRLRFDFWDGASGLASQLVFGFVL